MEYKSMSYVNVRFCESIRRIVEGVVAKTKCDEAEAIDEVAVVMNMDPGSVRLALSITA